MDAQAVVDDSHGVVARTHFASTAEVVRGQPLSTGEVQKTGVRDGGGTRQLFGIAIGLQHVDAEQAAQRPYAVNGNPLVFAGRQIIWLNNGGLEGIRGSRLDKAGALRPQLVDAELQHREPLQRFVRVVSESEVELYEIGRAKFPGI